MSKTNLNSVLRQLPAIHAVLASQEGQNLIREFGYELTVEAAEFAVGSARRKIQENPDCRDIFSIDRVIEQMSSYLKTINQPHLRKVVNATGIILHTNLGRAIMSKKAQDAILRAASHYSNLEYNLQDGIRGSRYEHVEQLLVRLTGGESALVVNNNAGAVLLAINTLSRGKEVIVSRGELVEIGGSFRIPEVMQLGGVTLKEVGTTNRTHKIDYQKALGESTGLILKVHTSNYRITGFTKSVSRKELVSLVRDSGIPLVEDLGSGSLIDLSSCGLQDETPVPRVVAEGVDVVTFSGDKLLGGPQAGIIVGKKQYIDRMKANQLARALRIDKLTLAGLEATLREYLKGGEVFENVPLYHMLTVKQEDLEKKAGEICGALEIPERKVSIRPIPTMGQMGGGSLPGQNIPSYGIAVTAVNKRPAEIEAAMRLLPVPVIGYIEKEQFILDLRTLLPGDEVFIIQGLQEVFS